MKKLHSNTRVDRQRTSKDEFSSTTLEKPPNSSNTQEKEGEAGKAEQSTNDDLAKQENSSLKLIEDTGSITSDTKTLIRHLRVLRNAVYENYSP